jgi:hypothetical protein
MDDFRGSGKVEANRICSARSARRLSLNALQSR